MDEEQQKALGRDEKDEEERAKEEEEEEAEMEVPWVMVSQIEKEL